MCRRSRNVTESQPITRGRKLTNGTIIPTAVRGLSATSGYSVWGSCTGKMSPHNVWLLSPVWHTYGRARRLYEREALPLKDAYKKSHTLWVPEQSQSFEKSSGPTHRLILEILCERRETAGTLHGDTEASGSHFVEFILSQRLWCCWVLVHSLPCSLLAPEAYPPTSGPTWILHSVGLTASCSRSWLISPTGWQQPETPHSWVCIWKKWKH